MCADQLINIPILSYPTKHGKLHTDLNPFLDDDDFNSIQKNFIEIE